MHRVDLLSPDESLKLLAEWAGQKRKTLPPEAAEVARECGYLPLALAMVGAMIQRRPTAWPDALARLQQHDLAKLQTRFAGYPHPDLLRAIETSVDGLDDERLTSRFGRDVRQRYLELAVFPEDEPIPEAALAVLWGAAGLDEADVRDLMDELVRRWRRSARRGPATRQAVTAGKSGPATDPRATIESLTPLFATRTPPSSAFTTSKGLRVGRLRRRAGTCTTGSWTPTLRDARTVSRRGTNDGYYFQHLAYHLAQAGRHVELRELLRDADWLQAQLTATDTAALIGDFRWIEPETASSDVAQRELRRT